MRALLERLLGRKAAASTPESRFAAATAASDSDEDFSWMSPPRTLVDPVPWDRYWRDQFAHGVAGFVHMFCDDGSLVDVMRTNGLRTVLCVGNGISLEPRALAWAGFDVTALDLSPFATEAAKGAAPPEEFLADLVGGRSAGLNGHVEFVVGDLCDLTCCPGPYDVVIDRKTLQLYSDEERPTAMKAVANRLASPGIFFSHCHDGGWRPPAPPRHPTQSWFVAEGWKFWGGNTPLTERVAWLFTTTG
jgi:SAM-dependent methyltransferase